MMLDGHLAHLDYARTGDHLELLYIEVPRAAQGRGFAATLLRAVLAWVREQGLRVTPVCGYVKIFFRRHPEYADLLASA